MSTITDLTTARHMHPGASTDHAVTSDRAFVDSADPVPSACYTCDPTGGPVGDGVVALSWTTRSGTERREWVCLLCVADAVYQRVRDSYRVCAEWMGDRS